MLTNIRLLWYLLLLVFLIGKTVLLELVLKTQIDLGNAHPAVTLLLRKNKGIEIYIGNLNELRIYDYVGKYLEPDNKKISLENARGSSYPLLFYGFNQNQLLYIMHFDTAGTFTMTDVSTSPWSSTNPVTIEQGCNYFAQYDTVTSLIIFAFLIRTQQIMLI